jgi:hypothetical protein
MTGVRFLAGAEIFSLRHRVQTGSGVHPAPYPVGTDGSYPGVKAAGTWIWPVNLHLLPILRMRGAIPPLPCLVKHRDSLHSRRAWVCHTPYNTRKGTHCAWPVFERTCFESRLGHQLSWLTFRGWSFRSYCHGGIMKWATTASFRSSSMYST